MGGMWPATGVCALFACPANWPRLPYTLACSISLCGGIIVDTVKTEEIISLPELEALAEGHLSAMAKAYVRGGAADELTLRANCEDWQRMGLMPKELWDVSQNDLETAVLSQPCSSPILPPCTAFNR